MANIQIVKYDESYREDLEDLLLAFSEEVFGEPMVNLDAFVGYHWVIYLAKCDDEVVGFTSFIYNTYYGLRTPTIGNDYVYIKPAYRAGRTMYMMALQAGKVCVEVDLPLEYYYITEASLALSKKIEGTKMYDAIIYPVEEITRKFKALTKQNRI